MVSGFGISEWMIVGCLLCLALFTGNVHFLSPQTWHRSSASSQGWLCFVCLHFDPGHSASVRLQERMWSIHRYHASIITALPVVTLLRSPLPLSLNWSVCLGLGSVCGGNYSVPNKSVVFIQIYLQKCWFWCHILYSSSWYLLLGLFFWVCF